MRLTLDERIGRNLQAPSYAAGWEVASTGRVTIPFIDDLIGDARRAAPLRRLCAFDERRGHCLLGPFAPVVHGGGAAGGQRPQGGRIRKPRAQART
ncbi:MAG TPA: hypothetical protein VND64_06880 [Pirellulales bacterium]|nr:hypothetical protein [Pirellulales bacterium]